MNDTPDYTGAWLAMTLGVEPLEIDRRRRAGELLGVPTRPGEDYRYPAWQFDQAGRPLPVVERCSRPRGRQGSTPRSSMRCSRAARD